MRKNIKKNIVIGAIFMVAFLHMENTGYADSNNSPDTATEIKLGSNNSKQWYKDEYTNNVREDSYYKFKTNEKGILTLSVTRPLNETTGEYAQVKYYLYNEDKIQIWNDYKTEYRDNKATKYSFHICVPAGTYYLNMVPDFAESDDEDKKLKLETEFSLKLKSGIKCELEPDSCYMKWADESAEFATALNKGSKYQAYINYQGETTKNGTVFYKEEDYFSYQTKAGKDKYTDVYVKIYNYDKLKKSAYEIWYADIMGMEVMVNDVKSYSDGTGIFKFPVYGGDKGLFCIRGKGLTSEIEYGVEIVDGYISGNNNDVVSINSGNTVKAGQTFTSGDLKYKIKSVNTKKKTGTCQIIGTKDKNISKVSIKSTVKKNGISYTVTLAGKCFASNKKITKVTIGTGIKAIPAKAFENCTALKTVTIGKSVTSIGDEAFKGCKKLTSFTYKYDKISKVGKNVFKGINKKARLDILYKSAAKKFKGKGQPRQVKIISKK